MEMKTVEKLSEGDILKRKYNFEYCTLKQIIKGDEEDRQNNFGFFGFFSKEKVMKKMFYSAGNKIFTYNDEIKS
jgi:hypothetical protein